MDFCKIAENTFQFRLNGELIVAECYRLVNHEKKSYGEVQWIMVRDRRVEYLPESIAQKLEEMFLESHQHIKRLRHTSPVNKAENQLSLF